MWTVSPGDACAAARVTVHHGRAGSVARSCPSEQAALDPSTHSAWPVVAVATGCPAANGQTPAPTKTTAATAARSITLRPRQSTRGPRWQDRRRTTPIGCLTADYHTWPHGWATLGPCV